MRFAALIEPARGAGVSTQALEDAVVVCGCFNTIDRMADALSFDVPDAASFAIGAKAPLRFGYTM